MALVQCPECRKEVSSQATACPHCGFALAAAPRAAGAPFGGLPTPVAEQTLWEASPSLLLLLDQVLGVAVVVVGVVVLTLLVLPALLAGLGDVARTTWANPGRAPLILALVLGAYLLFRGIRIALVAARLRTTRYRLTNQRLVIETGLLSRGMLEVDLRSVDDLAFRQGPVERLLGIGSISVVSSDKTAPRLRLQGVKDPRGVRELIRTQAYAASQRQLFTRAT